MGVCKYKTRKNVNNFDGSNVLLISEKLKQILYFVFVIKSLKKIHSRKYEGLSYKLARALKPPESDPVEKYVLSGCLLTINNSLIQI